ncbi:MAG: universal stress protein [Hyphomicrobiales bacterium]
MLFSPFRLGPYTLKNRLVALPVFSGYALPDGRVSDLLINHYRTLSRSGVAMVVVANAAVAADGVVAVNNLRSDLDDFLPGLQRLAQAIKSRGSVAVLQLNHGGCFAKTPRPLAPSALDATYLPFHITSLKGFMNFFPLECRFALTREFMQRVAAGNRPMGEDEKQDVAAAFGEAAARACTAGFDAVELHGATGYLLTQFLSGFTHKDSFGSPLSFDERIRFPLRVVREVKRRLPEGFPVGFRLLLREWVPGGIDLEEALSFAAKLAAEGINYVSPSVATYHSMFLPEVRALLARRGYLKEDALALKKSLPIPVIVSGRILTPTLAEKLLAESAGDLIGLGRALRADPKWVTKARTGGRVRTCRNCNICLRRVVLEQGFTCTRWPNLVQERVDLDQRLLKRITAKTLWVVAGMQDTDNMQNPAAAAVIPARPDTSTTILFLKTADPDLDFDYAVSRFTAWSRALWQRRGVAGAKLFHKLMTIEGPPENLVSSEMEQGGFGVLILGRNHLELWRERFFYRQRAKVVSLIGTHPRWSEVLVPLDLGLVSLIVLRHLMHSLMVHPELRLDFLHVLQGDESAALKRWREIHTILGWELPVRLRLVPRTGKVAATILGELKNGNFGTIVMGKRGLSRIKHLLLGSVSSAVLQKLTNQSLLLID